MIANRNNQRLVKYERIMNQENLKLQLWSKIKINLAYYFVQWYSSLFRVWWKNTKKFVVLFLVVPKNTQLEGAYSYMYSVLVKFFLMTCESCLVMTISGLLLNLKSMPINEYRKTTQTRKVSFFTNNFITIWWIEHSDRSYKNH